MDSNIVGAFIGAIATILAAFISRSYVEHRVRTTNSQRPLGRITEVLLGWLSVFSIGSAVGFSLREKESYVNDRLGIVVGVVHFYFYGALVTEVEPKANLNITVSGYETRNLDLEVGQVMNYGYSGRHYQLILSRVTQKNDAYLATAHFLVHAIASQDGPPGNAN